MSRFSEKDIQDYLNNELPNPLREAFLKALETDEELKARTHMEQLIIKGVEHSGREAFKARVRDVVARHRRMRILKYALGIGLVLLLAFLIWQMAFRQEVIPEDQAIYAQLFETPSLLSARRNDNGALTDIDRWRQYYTRENYSELIEEASVSRSRTSEADLMLGIAYMSQEQWVEAVQVLAGADQSNPLFKDHLEWYIVLARFRMGENVKPSIEVIAKAEGHDHQEEAQAFLDLLK